jgi:hypothetical protein
MAELELKEGYKELWIEYQNGESASISDLTYDQLVERIAKWEAIEFEARAKRQKCLADKRVRDEKRKKEGRDALINDPHYTPTDGPTAKGNSDYIVKQKTPRLSKEEKLKGSLGELGVDLNELLAMARMKKEGKLIKGEGK